MGYAVVRESQFGAGATAFAHRVEALTDGKYRVEQYPGSELGGEVEMFEAVRRGELDLALLTAVTFSREVPEFGAFDLPFLMRDAAHAYAVLDGPVGRGFFARFRERGVVPLAWGENGLRHLTNSKRPVRTLADIAGLKLRVPQSDVTLRCFRALATVPEPLPFPALYDALASGRFDGQENPIAVIQPARFAKVQKYLSLTGHVYSAAIIFMSRDAWEDLSAAERDAFEAAAHEGGQVSRRVADEAQRTGVEALRAEGMEVVTDVDRDSFAAALRPLVAEYAEAFGPDLIARIRAAGT